MSEGPLSILVIGSLPPPIGGTTVLLEALIREISDREDVSVRAVDTSGIRGGAGGLLRLPAVLVRIAVGALKADVISSHVHLSSFHLTVPFALVASLALRKSLIVRLFGGKDVLGIPGLKGAVVRWLARRADLLLVETKELLRSTRSAGMKNCAWYSNSRPAADAPARYDMGADHCRRFVFMSQVRPEKGIAEILLAAERLEQDVTIDIYGPLMDGMSEADFEKSNNVHYMGVVAPEDVKVVLSDYDALLLPTYHDGEGYPGVIIEAFSGGMPVICTHWRALPEIVDETCGLLVAPRDGDSLHAAMAELMSDPELYARVRAGALARAERFSSRYWSERFVEYCREVVGRPCMHVGQVGRTMDDESNGRATFAFVGDIHLGEVPPPTLQAQVREVLDRADFVVANQESPLSDLPVCVVDTIGLRSASGSASVLSEWGIDAVSLANNHIFDCGADGYLQTRDALAAAGVRDFGAGRNLADALEPLELVVNGLHVHFLSFVEEETGAVMAGEDSHGCAPLYEDVVTGRIAASVGEADAVVVLVHWGYCDYLMPSPDQERLVKLMFDMGVAAVVGHHSHVVQGVRRRAERLVAYSLGNFAFAEYTHRDRRVKQTSDNLRGVIVSMGIDSSGVAGCEVHLTRYGDGAVRLDRSAARIAEFSRRCRVLLPSRLEANWKRAVTRRLLRRALHWANPAKWSVVRREQIAGGRIMLKEIARRGE